MSDFPHQHPFASSIDQEKVYRLLFETAAEGLIVTDLSGSIIVANGRAEELFGYPKGGLLGVNVDMLVPAARRHNHAALRKNYIEKPTRRPMGNAMDLMAQRLDGSTIPVEVSLNHTVDNGEAIIMALITDISKRKAAEAELEKLNVELEQRVVERTRELKESQRLYSLIARNFPNGTINVFDRQLNYVFVEGRELFKLGVTSDELVGTPYLDRIPPEVAPMIKAKLLSVFEGEAISFEASVGENTYEFHCVGLDGVHGEVHHILVVEHDVTRQKRAEEEVRNALSKERELNELKSRFVSMASHEFRTPLSTILTSLALAQRYEGPEDLEKRQKHLVRIKTSVHNLTGILNDFLSFDKLETGHIAAKIQDFDISALLADVLEEMQSIAKPGQSLQHSHEGITACVSDPAIIRNIFINLISNAIKYSPEGKPIAVRTKVDAEKATASITDQGIGIPQADQVHMFERFFRANNATNIQGTGLGLTIVQKYLDLLGGAIWFESHEGKGTTFTFVIPQSIVP